MGFSPISRCLNKYLLAPMDIKLSKVS